MAGDEPAPDVLRFIQEQIDSVPHLEALLFLYRNRSPTTAADLAGQLYISAAAATRILRDLELKKLVVTGSDADSYALNPLCDGGVEFISRVAATYQQNLVRIATMLHAKVSSSVLDFARAFEGNKEK